MIAFYKGTSAMSRLIRSVNWGEYSHVAWLDPDHGDVVEAWTDGGVRQVESLSERHTAETVVDLFTVPLMTRQERDMIRQFLHGQIGKKYDWSGILHFVTRRPEHPRDQQAWFCSELIFAAFLFARLELLARIPAYKVFPSLMVYSPILVHIGTVTTGTRGAEFEYIRPMLHGLQLDSTQNPVRASKQPLESIRESALPEGSAVGGSPKCNDFPANCNGNALGHLQQEAEELTPEGKTV